MKFLIILISIFSISCTKLNHKNGRVPSSVKKEECYKKPSLCNFHIIAHRGAPRIEAENTIESFDKAIHMGANALEIDITISLDKQILIFHDRDPKAFLSVLRKIGIEGFKYIPYFPAKDSPFFKKADELTLAEIQEHWGYTTKVGGDKVPNKLIPSLKHFAHWSYKKHKLDAIYIDFKIEEDQLENLEWIAVEIDSLFKNAHYDTLIMVPRPKVYKALKKWKERNGAHFKILYDFEKHGVVKAYKKEKFTSVSMGSTLYTGWEKYLEELTQILKVKNRKRFLYPVVSWTVDDPKDMYTLIQKGVDGIVTNDPDLLYQLKNHHYKDHSKIVHLVNQCAQKNNGSRWSYCGNGLDIGPLKDISLSEVKSWLCDNYYYEEEVKSLFGCHIKGDDVIFVDPVSNSKDLQVWKSPEGQVYVLNVPASKTKEVFLLNADEKLCNDGVFNYSCEYAVEVEYLNSQSKVIKTFKLTNHFDGKIFAPIPIIKESSFVKIKIHETDSGKIKDTYEQVFPSKQLLNGSIHYPLIMESKNDTFQLWSSIQKVNLPKEKQFKTKSFALSFNTLHCNDGLLNQSCEYKLRIGYKNSKGRTSYKFIEVNKNKFTTYLDMPVYVKEISVEVVERDGGKDKNASRVKANFSLFHGSHKALIASDYTFSTYIKLLNYDYDQHQYDDQGFNKQKSPR